MKRTAFFSEKTRMFCSSAVLAFVLIAGNSQATNGYFAHGIGIKYKALAGAGIALYLSPLSAASNPASMAFLGTRYDVNFTLFNPNREYSVSGNPSGFPGTFGLAPGTFESDSKTFLIPSLGANWQLNETISFGVSIYGNGGMNTDYQTQTFGFSPTGVDLAQLFIAPTLSIQVNERHGFGITPIFAWQRFRAQGLAAFGNFSSDATKLSDNNYNNSTGFGARIGYLGQWLDFLSVGAAYQTKISMSEFDDYAGLFAEQGDFDIPANWTVGVALGYQGFGVVFDVQKMMYSDIKSVGNPMDLQTNSPLMPNPNPNPNDPNTFFLPNPNFQPLGSANGWGFGWDDMTVVKIGAYLQTGDGWTWRAGFSFGDQPIPESEVLFNILAPGVIENHLTFGFSKEIAGGREINIVVMRAFSNSVTGANPLEAPGRQSIELKMDQWEVGVGFSF
jgi:long-chain fatty acid transport protein